MDGKVTSFVRWILFLLVILTPALTAAEESSPKISNSSKWHGWAEIGGFGSSEYDRAELTVFHPFRQDLNDITFLQLDGKFFSEDIRELNAAIGHRFVLDGLIAGGFISYDIRGTTNNNTFHQIALGFEALTENFDARANFYLPISEAEGGGDLAKLVLSGNKIFMTGGLEVPLAGLDGELGIRLLEHKFSWGQRHSLWLHAGAFHFDSWGEEIISDITGWRARSEWRIDDIIPSMQGSRLSLRTEFRDDDVRGDHWEGGLRVRIPFSRQSAETRLTALETRMIERVERDIDIVTAESDREPVEDAITNVDFDQVAYANAASDINQAATAGPNTLIIANGANGTIVGNQRLQPRQTLVGGSGTISVRGRNSGTFANFTAPGTRPEIFNNTNLAVLSTADLTHIADVDVRGAPGSGINNDGIQGGNNERVWIEDVKISNVDIFGIGFMSGNQINIQRTTITGSGQFGIYFEQNNTLTASNVTIGVPNASAGGVNFDTGNTVSFFNTHITGAPSTGTGFEFQGNNTVNIASSTITDISRGIRFTNGNNVTITDTAFVHNDTGITSTGGGNSISLNNSNFAGAFTQDGLSLAAGNTLSGIGNDASAATFTGTLCNVAGGQFGFIVFDTTPGGGGQATCP